MPVKVMISIFLLGMTKSIPIPWKNRFLGVDSSILWNRFQESMLRQNRHRFHSQSWEKINFRFPKGYLWLVIGELACFCHFIRGLFHWVDFLAPSCRLSSFQFSMCRRSTLLLCFHDFLVVHWLGNVERKVESLNLNLRTWIKLIYICFNDNSRKALVII